MALPRTISEAAGALHDRSISSVELVTGMLERAERLDPPLGCYLARFEDAALRSAEQADAELASGQDRGPLHGIPVALKDNIAAREGPTTAQSLAIDAGWGAGQDATVVTRLREAGAVITGKTTLSEFALSAQDPTMPFPVPLNPWDLSRSAGGSSSGSGNGVAAGLFLGALGTDTGGSVRQPAHFNGVTGLRPTFGLVPATGLVPTGYTFDCIGPMARSARDCAILLSAISGVRGPDEVSDRTDTLAGATIGVYRPHAEPLARADADVAAAFEAAVGDLEAAGAQTREVRIPFFRELTDANYVGLLAEALAYHWRRARERWNRYGCWTRLSLAQGALYSANDYLQAQRLCRLGLGRVQEILQGVDVIVLPTMGDPAWPFSSTLPPGFMTTRPPMGRFTAAIASLRVPAVSVPMGLTGDGLPCGLQIVGRPHDDNTVLGVAEAYQRITSWHLAEPSFSGVPARLPDVTSSTDPPPDPAHLAATRDCLGRAGLPASDEEIELLARSYPYVRDAADAVCAAASDTDLSPFDIGA
jgi:aspartyl-tRNA(Asn)/glutamyl-tRNA(Gln) amidotransferase subunit A